MPKRKYNDDASGSFARLDVFARGMIWGMHVAKASREDICNEVVKKDVRPPSIQAVDQVIAHMKAWPILPRQPPALLQVFVLVRPFCRPVGRCELERTPCGVRRALIRNAPPSRESGDFVLRQ